MQTFKCICGKEYLSTNALQSHQHHHCKLCLSEEQYAKEYAHMKQMALIQADRLHKASQLKKELIENNWISENHTCEKCGKVMLKKFGSGRFCSRYCANSRVMTTETRSKIKSTLLNNNAFIETLLSPRDMRYAVSGRYKGIFCASTWELAYLVYCLDNNINIVRCKSTFIYEYEGEKHRYLPDWYLPDTNTYVEIKGKNQFYNEKIVRIKLNALAEKNLNYIYIDDTNINFYIEYCKRHYNIVDIKNLYDGQSIKASKKHSSRTKGYTWMHKDGKNTLVNPSVLEIYLKDDWVKGKIKLYHKI